MCNGALITTSDLLQATIKSAVLYAREHSQAQKALLNIVKKKNNNIKQT